MLRQRLSQANRRAGQNRPAVFSRGIDTMTATTRPMTNGRVTLGHAAQRRRPRQTGPLTAAAGPVRPVLASTVRLVGQMQGSGFVEQPWLIERDSRFIQVSELLYRVAALADGRRTLE